jgi:hypothetical protein
VTHPTDILHEAKRLRLLAAVLELQHYTQTEAYTMPIPGGDRVIAIGAPAQVRALLADTALADDVIAFGASLLGHASTTDGMDEKEAREWVRARWQEWPGDGHVDQADSEGGHHD